MSKLFFAVVQCYLKQLFITVVVSSLNILILGSFSFSGCAEGSALLLALIQCTRQADKPLESKWRWNDGVCCAASFGLALGFLGGQINLTHL